MAMNTKSSAISGKCSRPRALAPGTRRLSPNKWHARFCRCVADVSLLAEIVYERSLMRAHAQSQVFKFADSNQLSFSCQVRLCQKQMNMCDGITVGSSRRIGRLQNKRERWTNFSRQNAKKIVTIATSRSPKRRRRQAAAKTQTPICGPKTRSPTYLTPTR